MRNYAKLGIVLGIIIALWISLAVIQVSGLESGTNLKYIGSLPVNTFHNFIYNGTLYSQEGYMTRVYDLSPEVDRTKVDQRSYVSQFSPGGNDYATDSGYLYVLTSTTLEIYDISTPYKQLHPEFIGNIAYGGTRLVISGGKAYIASNGIIILDVSNPANPFFISKTTTVPAQQIAFDGRYAYTGYLSGDLNDRLFTIWDCQNPNSPVIVNQSQFTTQTAAQGLKSIAYRNNTIYLTSYATTFQAWDVTNRSAPVRIDVKNWHGVNLKVYDHYLLVSVRYGDAYPFALGGFGIWDISNNTPSAKAVGKSKETTFYGYTEDISTDGLTVAVSANTCGEIISDITNIKPGTDYPTLSIIAVPSTAYALEATTIGNLDVLAVGGRDAGTWFWNITDPENTPLSKTLATWIPGGVPRQYGVSFQGNYSYGTFGTNGANFVRIDLTGIENQPEFKPVVTKYNNGINDIFVVANETRIYVNAYGADWAGLFIYNNTGTNTSKIAGKYIWKQPQNDWVWLRPYNNTENSTPYLIGSNGYGLYIWDVTADSPFPALVYNGTGKNISALNYNAYDPVSQHIYVKHGTGDAAFVKAINVADLNNIYEEPGQAVTFPQLPNTVVSNGTDVFVGGGARYASTGNIQMIDFSNPAKPVLVDHVNTGGTISFTGMTYYKGYLYAGDENSITIWKVIPSGGVQPEPTQTVTPVVTRTTITPTVTPTASPTPDISPDDTGKLLFINRGTIGAFSWNLTVTSTGNNTSRIDLLLSIGG